jgi:tRNA-specific 2-thiouridylase
VQVRYRSKPIPANILGSFDGAVALALEAPATAVAPGQSGVLYRGDQVLGGGVIA